MKAHLKHLLNLRVLSSLLGIFFLFGVFISYRYYVLARDLKKTQEQLDLTSKTSIEVIKNFEENLLKSKEENTKLALALQDEQKKNGEFESQIKEISGTLGVLDKLSKTDRELLKKYSKVYFLNENYIPPNLMAIDPIYLLNKDKTQQVHADMLPFLLRLFWAATEQQLDLKVISAFRSFGTQETLKSQYSVVYGAGTANQFSADQGYSEHQLGTAIDFTTTKIGNSFSGFEQTKEYTWLTENAYRYGFVLSYPKGNSFYVFEPWHWRFVGLKLARVLHDAKKYFYDFDQRAIDSYLVNIFDFSE